MPLSPEFVDFYQRWLSKANERQDDELSCYFDNYFSLFVAFNRLYAEATFILARKNELDLSRRTTFPDDKAAKKYVLQYLTSTYYISKIEHDRQTLKAIEDIKALLRHNKFNIKLDMITGNKQPEKDNELLRKLESSGKDQKSEALLDILYSVRCNMFHGNKGFHPIQLELLKPLTVLLRSTVEILYAKLEQDES